MHPPIHLFTLSLTYNYIFTEDLPCEDGGLSMRDSEVMVSLDTAVSEFKLPLDHSVKKNTVFPTRACHLPHHLYPGFPAKFCNIALLIM